MAQPSDAPDASLGYDKWAKVVYADIVQGSFSGESWDLINPASVTLDVVSGVSSGTVGLQLEVNCGGVSHKLPSAHSLTELPFTTSWNSVVPPPVGALRT